MTSKFKVEGTGVKHTKRITRDGVIVAMAQQLANDQWAIHDPDDDQRVTPLTFGSANAARNWVKERILHRGSIQPDSDDIS